MPNRGWYHDHNHDPNLELELDQDQDLDIDQDQRDLLTQTYITYSDLVNLSMKYELDRLIMIDI